MTEKRVFSWSKNAARYGFDKVDPYLAVEVYDRLKDEGRLTAKDLLAEAENLSCPLHAASGWHWGDVAAIVRKYRLQVASTALSGLERTVEVMIDGAMSTETIPVVVQRGKTTIHGRGSEYVRIEEAMADRLDRAELMTRLLHEMRRLDRYYATLLAEFPLVAARWAELRRALELTLEPPAAS